MKKFLLVLSCFLATWCSVQAGPKSSPEISLMQASAPAAAPVTNYPAVINSAYHDPDNHVIVVDCDQNNSGALAFFAELGGNRPEIYRDTKSSPGAGKTVKIPLKPEWELAEGITILISVGDGVNICGGRYVRLEHPDPAAKINKISYIPANKKVRVGYSIINPKSEACYIKVHKNSKTGSEIYKAGISSSSTMFEIPSSKFTKGALYYVEISVGNLKVFEKYIFDNVRSGYMGAVSVNYHNVTFNYNLKNASDPYIAIKQGSKEGPVVTKFKVENTNGSYEDVDYYYPSVLKENKSYVADLYDGSEDLRIFSEMFTIPGKPVPPYFDFNIGYYYNQGTKKLEVWADGRSDWTGKVSIWIYKNNSGNLSIHDFKSGKINQRFPIGIEWANPQNYTIVIEAGGIRKDLTVCIGENVR